MFPVLGLSSFKLSPIDSNRALPICRVLRVLSERNAPLLSRIFLVDGDCMSFSTIFALLFGVLGRLHLAFHMALFSVEDHGNIFSDSSFSVRDLLTSDAMISFLNMPVSSVVPFLSLLTYVLCLSTFFSVFSCYFSGVSSTCLFRL